MLVHEWRGITRHVHQEARKFAGQGYTAFTADRCGDGNTAGNPSDAGALSGAVHRFTNPEATEKGLQFKLPLAYHAEVDRQSKAEAAKFFRGAF